MEVALIKRSGSEDDGGNEFKSTKVQKIKVQNAKLHKPKFID